MLFLGSLAGPRRRCGAAVQLLQSWTAPEAAPGLRATPTCCTAPKAALLLSKLFLFLFFLSFFDFFFLNVSSFPSTTQLKIIAVVPDGASEDTGCAQSTIAVHWASGKSFRDTIRTSDTVSSFLYIFFTCKERSLYTQEDNMLYV